MMAEKTVVIQPNHRRPLQLSPKQVKEQIKRKDAKNMFWHWYHKPYRVAGGSDG